MIEARHKSTAGRPKVLGRPKGAGGYALCDQPLIAEMRAGIEAGRFHSIWASATHTATRAAGGGTHFAKTLRLYNRYTKAFGRTSIISGN